MIVVSLVVLSLVLLSCYLFEDSCSFCKGLMNTVRSMFLDNQKTEVVAEQVVTPTPTPVVENKPASVTNKKSKAKKKASKKTNKKKK